jgi:hypothetical protein
MKKVTKVTKDFAFAGFSGVDMFTRIYDTLTIEIGSINVKFNRGQINGTIYIAGCGDNKHDKIIGTGRDIEIRLFKEDGNVGCHRYIYEADIVKEDSCYNELYSFTAKECISII